MANSPILAFPLIEANQNQKETTANTAFLALESATQDSTTYDLSGGNVSATLTQFNRAFMHTLTGASVSRIFTIPSVNKRVFAVLNECSASVTVTVSGGSSVIVPASNGVLFFSDGVNLLAITNSGFVAGNTSDFIGLTDVPLSYVGQAGNLVRVAATEDQLEFAPPSDCFVLALTDEVTPLTLGVKLTMRMPYAFKLTGVKASLTTASASGAVSIGINKNGSNILSTPLTIDVSEKTSVTAATPAVLGITSFADDDEMVFSVLGAGSVASGLKVYLVGNRI